MAHIEKQAGELQEKLIAVNRVSKTLKVVVFSPSQL
ncbi:30S ribosomal protein S5 [Klebsiella pneumoniae subsp. ozaenae]|uniref:30S ribosomal protein S5 n=1 Tax=Klebsiella pneumoniae subsp. ozaenae TaxID=574 RepID=A0A378AJU6_KLEPO|nr:30S ribosomal protein S5 [Klebsiella pneumoniae subsp. ozaenae]